MTCSFETLPPEIFRSILTYLLPKDVAALACTCRRFNLLTQDNTIWRDFYLTRYTYYTRILNYTNDEYLPESVLKPRSPADTSTWQDLFNERALQDKQIRLKLNEIITNRGDRIHNIELISSTYGLLALDVLKSSFPPSFHHSSTLSLETRHLAREYYSLETARLISREIGLHLLDQMKSQRHISSYGRSLFNALYIIQCFHPHGLFLSINRLHRIGKQIRTDSQYEMLNLTEKCEILLKKMQEEKFLPANGGSEYYDIENSFLYSAFDGKPTIPLTLVAIFCALAEECGLKARPLGFPGEVMAQVDPLSSSDHQSPLIISVFDGKVISLTEINDRLSDVIDFPLSHPLSVTSIIDLVIRSARNMINCITRYSTSFLNAYGLYAAVSVLKILGSGALPFAFDSMMTVFKDHFPMDLRFFELISSPMTEATDEIRRIRLEDSRPPPITIKRRQSSLPKYRIGQIFRHIQYEYWAVICGWDLSCQAPALWQARMGIDSLTRGASQPFYHILSNDSSRRYVAEDNIDLDAFLTLENVEERQKISETLCNTEGIGKHFQQIDRHRGQFVPTEELREEYPDDE